MTRPGGWLPLALAKAPWAGGALFLLLGLGGCTVPPAPAQAARVQETQAVVARAIDCDRLGAPIDFEAHASAGAPATAAPVGPLVRLRLRDLQTVSSVLPPGRPGQSQRYAGLLPFRVPTSGTYTVLVASLAWADTGQADPPRLLAPQSFEWVTLCGKRYKSGVYSFESARTYVVQLWDSPDRELDVMIRGLP